MIWQTMPLPARPMESRPREPVQAPRPPAGDGREPRLRETGKDDRVLTVSVPVSDLEDIIECLWEVQRRDYVDLPHGHRRGHIYESLMRLKFFAARVRSHRGRLNLR